MIDFFYGYCITETALQAITKTQVVGLQKLKGLIFLSFFVTIHLNEPSVSLTELLLVELYVMVHGVIDFDDIIVGSKIFILGA